jgi:hypothetical protein
LQGYEKLSKHSTKIQALQEQVTATKALEKEVKARKTKISDESVEIMALDTKIIEWDGKGCQTVLTFCSIAEFVYALSILKYSFPHVIA